MNSDRIKEIQETTAYPESVSIKQALLQVWNECEQEQVKNLNIPIVIKAEGDSVCLLNRDWRQCDTHNGSYEGCGNCKHFKQTDL